MAPEELPPPFPILPRRHPCRLVFVVAMPGGRRLPDLASGRKSLLEPPDETRRYESIFCPVDERHGAAHPRERRKRIPKCPRNVLAGNTERPGYLDGRAPDRPARRQVEEPLGQAGRKRQVM